MTSFIGNHGLVAVFFLMAVAAVLPAASELTMIYGGALASGALAGHISLGGHHFQPLDPAPPLTARVIAVALAPSDRCRMAAITEHGQLALSVDCCTRWQTAMLPAAAAPIYALAIT